MITDQLIIDTIRKDYFDKLGIDYNNTDDINGTLYQLFNFEERYIKKIKRNVFESLEFSSNLKSLDKKEQNYIKGIISRLKKGHNVNMLQSNYISSLKKLRGIDYRDILFNRWKIFHLHLTEGRTNNLIFIRKEDEDFYLLDIKPHNDPLPDKVRWNDEDLFRIMKSNFPHLIKNENSSPYVINENIGTPNEKEAYELERKGYLMATNVDGKGYLNLGGLNDLVLQKQVNNFVRNIPKITEEDFNTWVNNLLKNK